MSIRRPGVTPYVLTVELRICECGRYPVVLESSGSLAKLCQVADGVWSIFTTFWGQTPGIINLLVVDTRDGQVMWRNGRPLTTGGESGTEQSNQGATAGEDGGRDGRAGVGAQRRPVRPGSVAGEYRPRSVRTVGPFRL